MGIDVIALILSLIAIVILIVILVLNNKKFNNLIQLQEEMKLSINANDHIEHDEIVNQVLDKIKINQEIQNLPDEDEVSPEVESFDKEEVLVDEQPEIEDFGVEIDIPQVEQRQVQIPTLDKDETAALLKSFTNQEPEVINVETENEIEDFDNDYPQEMSFDIDNSIQETLDESPVLEVPTFSQEIETQELGQMVEEINDDAELPKFDAVEEKQVDNSEIIDQLSKIKRDFDVKLIDIRSEINSLNLITDQVVREHKKSQLKQELINLKSQIIEFQKLENEVKNSIN